ncbi:T9SS type A sorting domain-containing protein [Cruoricaptor ignavus]|uniref:T9SS type A sorting domain-containing protein n=1 Tax=Cruoricaptor ignavus TaxID=1118202 RepID=UPI00370DD1DE
MKRVLFFALAFCVIGTTAIAQVDANGYTTVNVTMGKSYANRVFFDFSANKLTVQPSDNWDVAFYRNSAQDFGARINDAMNVETYQVSNDPSLWDAITTTASTGTVMYNSDITERIQDGVFSQGNPGCANPAFAFGFGCYNVGTHHIEGKVIYLLKYGNGNYVKFMITDYYGGYTFKYAKWNGSAWGTTITKTIANGSADAYFNYYSFTNDAEVNNNEPAKNDWELMFTRYWTNYNNIMMYRMSGVIQSPRVTIAKETETQALSTAALPPATNFQKKITTIGHSWKGTNPGSLVENAVYYVKEDTKYYRMYFIENGGSANGNMTFKFKDITEEVLGINEIVKKANFGIFPNPAPNKQVTVVYDIKNTSTNKGIITIFDMTGRKVYATEIGKEQGFFKKELQLSGLSEGTYLINLNVDGVSETKKLILK